RHSAAKPSRSSRNRRLRSASECDAAGSSWSTTRPALLIALNMQPSTSGPGTSPWPPRPPTTRLRESLSIVIMPCLIAAPMPPQLPDLALGCGWQLHLPHGPAGRCANFLGIIVAMDEALRAALAAGRAAWPALALAHDVFVAALQAVLENGATLDEI